MIDMTNPRSLTTPIINLNGDRAETLLDQLRGIHDAIHAISKVLGNSSPHGRNYQCSPEGAYDAARRQHQVHCDALRNMEKFYTDQYLEIADQVRDSKRR